MDRAVANFDSNDTYGFLGQENGNFAVAATIAVDVGPAGIAIGAFNGDGFLDVVSAGSFADNLDISLSIAVQQHRGRTRIIWHAKMEVSDGRKSRAVLEPCGRVHSEAEAWKR